MTAKYTVQELVDLQIIEKPLDGNHGSIHPTSKDYVEDGIPFIMASDLSNGLVNFSSCKFITEKQANTLRKGFSIAGDILLSHKATIGRTATVQENKYPFLVLTPQVTYYRVKDKQKLNNLYLKYYFDSQYFQSILQQWAGSGSTRAYIGITEQLKLPIILPDIDTQNEIVDIINRLDQKIYLNTQINQTLEQIAQALFKSWFVDFDPVRAKVQALSDGLSLEQAELAAMQAISGKTAEELTALSQTQPDRYAKLVETAKAFPCEMVEVEGVEVPKGWKTIPFKDFIKDKKEKVGSLKNIPEYSVTNNGIIPRSQKFNKQLSKNPEKNKLLHKTDLVFGMSREILNWGIMVDDIGSVSSAYHVYSIDKNVINHLYLKMMMMNKFQYFNELIRPSSREGQSFDKELLKEKTVIVPSNFLLDHFLYKLELLNHQINTIKKETKTLISIRDTLLPELLNGKI